MQFSTFALFSSAAIATSVVTVEDVKTVLATITSCGPEVINCPGSSIASVAPTSSVVVPETNISNLTNDTLPSVPDFEGAGAALVVPGVAAVFGVVAFLL